MLKNAIHWVLVIIVLYSFYKTVFAPFVHYILFIFGQICWYAIYLVNLVVEYVRIWLYEGQICMSYLGNITVCYDLIDNIIGLIWGLRLETLNPELSMAREEGSTLFFLLSMYNIVNFF